MKILYITLENMFLHKGSVVHIKEIVDGLQRRGHQVDVIDNSVRPFFFRKCLKSKTQSYALSSLFLFFRLFKALPRYDVIYARDFHTVLIALIPRIIFRKSLVFEINGIANEEQKLRGDSILTSIISSLIRGGERLATKYSDSIVSVTPQIASYLMKNFSCPREKIEVISNGVNTNSFHPIPDGTSILNWKEKLGIDKLDIVITFVGNLAPWQGVEYLIQVAPALLLRMKNIRFMIVGDGRLRQDLEREVKSLGVSRHFLFTGMVAYDQIPLYINISSICVILKKRLKSGYSPLKLYEYMACAKPIVASRVEGLEFIEGEGIGILMEPGDLTGLEKALLELLMDSQKRIDMGRKGLQLARDRFSWHSRVRRIERVLEKLA